MDASMARNIGRAIHRFNTFIVHKNFGNTGKRPRCLNACVRTRHNHHVLRQASSCRQFSSLAEQFQVASTRREAVNVHSVFRTQQDDPSHQSMAQEGLYYTVPEADVKQVFQKGLSVQFVRQCNTFNETCFMVRRPALEVIDCLKHLNLDHLAPRFMLYGSDGNGKTVTMAHILHYCYRNNWLIVHAPWPSDWNCRYHETSPSPHKAGRMDLPVEAADWLVSFRTQNAHLIKDMKLSQQYVWSKREMTEAGSPLNEIIDFGLNRMKFASDCVGAILKEVRQQAAMNNTKVLVAVDGVNAFWNWTTIKNSKRELLMADQISLVHNFKKMLLSNWTHGAIVCSVDTFANAREHRESPNPVYLLGKEGYKWLDPFIPIHVPAYSEKEAYSCLEYYLDRNWIQHKGAKTEEGKKELLFLSNKNPFQLMRICSSK